MSDITPRRPVFGVRLTGLAEDASRIEAAGFDFVQLGDPDALDDKPIGDDPLSVAAYLMTTTERMGLAATVPSSWAPFNVARALASFDHLSAGRCGWLPIAGEADPDPERLAEHREVVLKLFDSWDDEALVFDKPASIFADRDRVRRIRHEGRHFTVDGPLNAPRPVQGWPVILDRLEKAGPTTDIVLAPLEVWMTAPPSDAPLRLAEIILSTPDGVGGLADQLATALRLGQCDGALFAPVGDADVDRLVQLLAPRLIHSGPVDGLDFRSRLGLARPVNRHTATGR
jgi:alkanesulfonate monooxygenase SsuD/methylene tetrahydromethanopterin reductase-like flavin-dependent oxidoreductase (luciferase family)